MNVFVLQVIFRYTLALFKYKEDDILKIHDSVEIYQYLRFFTKTVSNTRYTLTFISVIISRLCVLIKRSFQVFMNLLRSFKVTTEFSVCS